MIALVILGCLPLWLWLAYSIGFERGEAKAHRYHVDQKLSAVEFKAGGE